jgi:septal ring-binding cell division protein DamX
LQVTTIKKPVSALRSRFSDWLEQVFQVSAGVVELRALNSPTSVPVRAADSARADSTSWVDSLDPNAWVMQHGAFDSLSEARTFQSSALGYKAGQVLLTQLKGSKPFYILITGPYAEKAQAEALMKQNPPLAKAWLRSVKSLKAQFQE